MKNRKISLEDVTEFILRYKAFMVLAVIIIASGFITKGLFFNLSNLSSVSRQIATPIFIALGYTVLISAGNMDLSTGDLVSMLGVIYAICALKLGVWVAIPVTIAISIVCGLISGFISLRFKIQSFIVTLAMAQIYTGVAYILSNGKSIAGMPDSVTDIGQGLLFGKIPISIVLAVIACILLVVIVRYTKLGRHILATGGNAKAATVAGVNTFFIQIITFAVIGVCSACGAIILTGRVAMALPAAGSSLTMDAIAAVAIGGTPMRGGKAAIGGTLIGCIIIGVISNVLNLVNVSSFWQWICKGLIILFALLLDAWTESFFSERQRKAGVVK